MVNLSKVLQLQKEQILVCNLCNLSYLLLAFFQSLGKMPVNNELLNIVVSEGAIILAESLISLADILSGPDAFLPFTQDINLKTSVNLICLNVKQFFAGV